MLEGVSVSFFCDGEEEPSWFFNTLQSAPISKSKIVTLYSVHQMDAGNYYCIGKYKHSDIHFIASTTLDVIRKSTDSYFISRPLQSTKNSFMAYLLAYFPFLFLYGKTRTRFYFLIVIINYET